MSNRHEVGITKAFDVIDEALLQAKSSRRILEGTQPNSERIGIANRAFENLDFAREELVAAEEIYTLADAGGFTAECRTKATQLNGLLRQWKDWFAAYMDMNA